MNTSSKYLLLLGFIGLFSQLISAQNNYQLGTLPSINLNKKLKKDWSVNLKIETRQIYQTGTFSGESDSKFKYELTDVTLVGARKLGFYSRLGAGYLLRYRNDAFVHRINQQYNHTKQFDRLRLSQRILTDQTFFSNESPEFRFRYRLSSQIPLNGTTLDLRELYIKLNNEYVNSWQQSEYDLEIRVIPMLGFAINKENKVEVGLDYRINSFVQKGSRQVFWLAVNWFVEL